MLRVWVDPETKTVGPPYWDITSQTLIVQLLPLLQRTPPEVTKVKIAAYGVAPRKRYSVSRLG